MRQLKIERFNGNLNRHSNLEHVLSDICAQVYQTLNKGKDPVNIHAEFYPYANLKLTARKRKGRLFIRMSDILTDAPDEILAAAANCIISQFLKTKCDEGIRKMYKDYIYSSEIRARVRETRRARVKKTLVGAQGKYYDLEVGFQKLNKKYFKGNLSKPNLTWSVRTSRTHLGHFDSDLDTLVLSRTLDKKDTPKYVIEFVLYHELLHREYPGHFNNGRRRVHTAEFKRAEQRFEEFERAKKWLKNR
ncbi:SprT-like domain-containing protein [[Eubacterium] cellulosolvens]